VEHGAVAATDGEHALALLDLPRRPAEPFLARRAELRDHDPGPDPVRGESAPSHAEKQKETCKSSATHEKGTSRRRPIRVSARPPRSGRGLKISKFTLPPVPPGWYTKSEETRSHPGGGTKGESGRSDWGPCWWWASRRRPAPSSRRAWTA